MSENRRSAVLGLMVLAIVAVVYFFWALRTKPPVIVHVLCIGVMLYQLAKMPRRLFQKEQESIAAFKGEAAKKIYDKILGPVELFETDDDYWWQTSIKNQKTDESIVVKMAGEDGPNEAIVERVRFVTGNWDHFISNIRQFLVDEAAKDSSHGREILSLKVESIVFFWPEKPDYAEIVFNGDTRRLWSCGYDHEKLFNLSVSG